MTPETIALIIGAAVVAFAVIALLKRSCRPARHSAGNTMSPQRPRTVTPPASHPSRPSPAKSTYQQSMGRGHRPGRHRDHDDDGIDLVTGMVLADALMDDGHDYSETREETTYQPRYTPEPEPAPAPAEDSYRSSGGGYSSGFGGGDSGGGSSSSYDSSGDSGGGGFD